MKSNQLVCQYLENISRTALEEYQEIIRKYVKGKNGIYALYNKNKLYYVGLATNLRSRLRHHLKDQHADAWDSFSVYLTFGDQHLHEIEALILRIIDRKGNKQKGKFKQADNLRRIFKSDFKYALRKEMERVFGGERKDKIKRVSDIKDDGEKKAVLAKYVSGRFHIRFDYKGKRYIAHVRQNGTISFSRHNAESKRLQGGVYYSPSEAAKAVTKHAMNGWTTWKYQKASGEWVHINELK